MLTKAVETLPGPDAKKYFEDWAADLRSRFLILDLAEEIYVGPGNTASNEAVGMLMHACDYLEDRVGYEMNPHPKGMIRLPQGVNNQ
jgi:hypothetical protein